MGETIEIQNGLYALHTAHTSYLFRILPSGQAEHLYYGARLSVTPGLGDAIAPKTPCGPGCAITYSAAAPNLCLDRLCSEASGEGKGDFGVPFVRLAWANGARTSDFVFDHAETPTAPIPAPLPSACDADAALVLVFHDADVSGLVLELRYDVFFDTDVIARTAQLLNNAGETVTVKKLASAQLDFPDSRYVFTAFKGAWADEMHRCDTVLGGASAVAESRCGDSSNLCNPFTMLARPGTTETAGEAYGMNLLYSGGHRTVAQPGAGGRLRWQGGLQPEGFSFTLAPGERFAAPQAVLCYSDEGYGALSRRLHAFTRRHIVRGTWRDKPRPVLLNSWEACYFKFDENQLLRLAKAGAEAGVELFVLDDGWFGKRDDDKSSLGDWNVNLKKLPHGLAGLAEKVNAMGMAFGLWVEPEMVNVDSELYRAHPDWAMAAPERTHSEGRNQRILDLANPAVQLWLIDAISGVLSSANISYVKWDMNRAFSDVYSPYLGSARQGEAAHRYILGLYEVLGTLTQRFPDVLFESCASGGNRADLGMLCFMPQFWASDDTDPIQRAAIQTGYSYAYPLSTLGCHVSASPNHQTLRQTPLDARFAVAVCGALGYELDFTMLSGEERKEISEQIALYKQLRTWLHGAAYYRTENGFAAPGFAGGGVCAADGAALPRFRWCAVSADGSHAVGVDLQVLAGVTGRAEAFRVPGLAPEALYRFSRAAKPVDIRLFGSLVNTMSPVRMKPGGVLHNVAAQFVHLPGESEDAVLSGAALRHIGAALCPAYCGTGLNEGVKVFPDFAVRLYRIERQDAALPAAPEIADAETTGDESVS